MIRSLDKKVELEADGWFVVVVDGICGGGEGRQGEAEPQVTTTVGECSSCAD